MTTDALLEVPLSSIPLAFEGVVPAAIATVDAEGMPNVIQEAMSCGLPIVTTNHAGIPDHIRSGENGLLVEEGDLAGFSDALDKLAADARLRKRLGTAARAYAVENIDYRICHARIEAFMEQG